MEKAKLLWLCRHEPLQEQKEALRELGDFEFIHYKNFLPEELVRACEDSPSDEKRLKAVSYWIAKRIFDNRITHIHLPIGSPALMWELAQDIERLSGEYKYQPVYLFSHSERVVEEKEDGTKISKFVFKKIIKL